MMIVITCAQCHNEDRGTPISLTETTFTKSCSCGSCTKHDQHDTTYHFCSLKCFASWISNEQVIEYGLPCQGCVNIDTGKPTGHMSGFKENPVCGVCNGTGRVMQQAAMAE